MSKPSILSRLGAMLTRVRNFVMNTVFILLLLIVLFAIVDAFDTPGVPDGSALVVNPEGIVVEESVPRDPFRDLWAADGVPETDIHELVRAIDSAADDSRIKMLVLDLDDLVYASAAHAEIIGATLARFREAGKAIVAVGEIYLQPQYAIASYADAVYMHPDGFLFLPGYASFRTYFKSMLDKLKLNVHVFRVGEYKSAVEPFIRDDMSEAAREANRVLVDGLWASYRQRVLTGRELDEESFDRYTVSFEEAVAQTGGDAGRAALEAGLVDELMTADQMRSHIADTVGRNEDNDVNGIGYRAYLKTLGPPRSEPGNVGLVFARGTIQMGDDRNQAASENLVRLIRKVREDEAVKALVLRVDSPGGSAFASELIRQELELVQLAGKPVVASMGSVAASGGYWISSTSDRILAHPTTITGSIGVLSLFFDMEESLSSIGIHTDGVGSSPWAGAMDPARKPGEHLQRFLQLNVEHGYRQFINLVARGRDMDPDAVEEIAQGRVWIGSQAHELGLVDGLGSLADAVAEAAELANLADYGIKRFTTPLSPRDVLIQQFMDAAEVTPPVRIPGALRKAWAMAESLNDPKDTYAICEPCLSLMP